MACSGEGSELCGGPLRLNVYNYTGSNLPPINNGGGGGGGGGTPVLPKLVGLPTGWSYNACWVYVLPCFRQDACSNRKRLRDNAHGRVFQTELPDNQALTIESCIASCASQDFTLAGAEFGVQCCAYNFKSIVASYIQATHLHSLR